MIQNHKLRLKIINCDSKSKSHEGKSIKQISFRQQEIIRHPKYSFRTKKNDIALIRLRKEISITEDISPACLQTDLRDEEPDAPLILIGWEAPDKSECLSNLDLQSKFISET